MNFSGVNGFLHEPVTPTRQATPIGNSPLPARHALRSTVSDTSSPTRQQMHGGLHSSPQVPDGTSTLALRKMPSAENPGTENNEAWSSAVGRATTGKSGRVIERLMADNDRFQRELKLATARLEEEIKRSELARTALDSLRATNENLKAMHDADKVALGRRERKIEDLKTDLEAERKRREMAEREARDVAREKDEVVDSCRKEVLQEKETSKRSTSQYEILSNSWKSLDEGYRRQTQRLKTDIKALREDRAKDQQRIAQLDIVTGQLHQESEKTRKLKDKMAREFEAYKQLKEEDMWNIKERAQRNESANEEALKEVTKVLGEMKWVMNVKRNVKGAG
ncbi:MAG: hypothetical protein MMC33_001839 [Icmadophila ericetorum]|nr:hypothetical protein [Icmadophila ericetorum]